MLLKKEQLWLRMQKKQIDPVYLFYGQEEFLIRDAINRIKIVFLGSEDTRAQAHHFFGDEVSIDRLVEFALTLSFGNPKRIISYRVMSKPKPSDNDLISSYMDNPSDDTIIIFTAEEVDLASTFFKCLQKKAIAVRFYPLFDNQIPDWIRRQAEQMGTKITVGAAKLLLDLVGPDLTLLTNELEKMSLYLMQKGTIDVTDIEKSVGRTKIFSIFELTKNLGERNTIKSLRILQGLIDAGQSPVGIVALIAYHFNRLMVIKTLIKQGKNQTEISKKIGVSSYFIKEYIDQASLFSFPEIEGLFGLFMQTDLKLKSSPLPQQIILESLIFKICCPGAVMGLPL